VTSCLTGVAIRRIEGDKIIYHYKKTASLHEPKQDILTNCTMVPPLTALGYTVSITSLSTGV